MQQRATAPCVSVLNDVLGPVMRGPSSSHTAGSFHIGRIAAGLLGAPATRAEVAFDPGGSYAQVYRQQGVDRGFAVGIMGWSLTDERFFDALDLARAGGLDIRFDVRTLARADHPNTVEVVLGARDGRSLSACARSVGGGAVEITTIDGWPVRLSGSTHDLLVEAPTARLGAVMELVTADGQLAGAPDVHHSGERVLVEAHRLEPVGADARRSLAAIGHDVIVREAPPTAFVKRGGGMFTSAAGMISVARSHGWSLGRAALAYEAALLGIEEQAVLDEVASRFDIMQAAVHRGLGDAAASMQLLAPSAPAISGAEAAGRLPIGGLHTRAAARAMAVMHVNSSMGVVCAAPTGGSSGAIPGVVVTLVEERGLSRDRAAMALLAASAVGVILATRATFAAEVAGCQVEIGAAGAMGAAAVVEAAGGTPEQACDAAAISFQNSMGSVCDLVGGLVEIPCHTRNAVAASSALVCADLIVGGYQNPIPLDDTIDAVYAVGRHAAGRIALHVEGRPGGHAVGLEDGQRRRPGPPISRLTRITSRQSPVLFSRRPRALRLRPVCGPSLVACNPLPVARQALASRHDPFVGVGSLCQADSR